ncbi:conserved hypothetical protein [Leishmania major strain Friedlin]|uniref:Uncharacterized protein n=1 Tax=Leishmania major TaxID=5664 RepID=Q4QGT1_LEIMA|nr:conserved hypothetical protein [Leishmania major strain Friedlin]CAG9570418.1 hypothetical_protein_-_conserved [Leishmania major strain Friedlin]CAJ02410.1 conserved hypothetical protein [Leishmania major strain Friedlin]|eukprot:XP_001681617.1 conserved hypothetical protein [Leishmania major strain Friedlin]
MRELIELRAELASERDRRHETLIAMGRQWKEDVLVEVHRRGAALQSDVSAVEEKMTVQWKESNEGRLVMRRQLEEAMRADKIRDTNQFQLREEVQETARQLEERVDMALAQSSAARADCSRQLEQERATLSQRLDAELLRLVEMRRDDQRALQQARELMRDEGLRVRDDIRRVVQEVWETSASALVKTATEPIEQLRAELRQTKAAAQAMEERVAGCVQTCQAECRTVMTTTTERLRALESKEAVAISSIDRAERKADSAYETARHMEAMIAAAKDATERALVQVAGAAERTLKVEHALTDRDSRLVAVEAQLHAIATAEGLRAEVEACKRQAGRLESRVEAAGALCTRVEQLADRAAQQVASFADRIESCERSTQRSADAVQRVQDGLEACESEGHQMRTRFETSEAVLQRHTHLLAQLEQQISGQENRLGLWRQQQEQHVKDQMTVQRELTERAEVTHTVASRAQQVSSDARAEVHRLERRIDDVDRRLTSTSAEMSTLRGCIDSQHTQALEAQRQQQQVVDELRSVASEMDERMAPVKDLVRNSAERMERAEAQAHGLGKKLAQCEERLHEMGARVQDYLKDAVRHHVGEAQKRLFAAVNEGVSRVTEQVAAVEEAADLSQQRVADMSQKLAAMQQASAKLQHHVQSLEASLQSLSGQTEKLAVHADTQAGDRQRLGTVQKELMCLTAMQQRTQQDVRLLQEAIRVLQAMATGGSMRDFSLSELGTSQARTASTEMAPAADAISSSPSAHHPSGSGVRTSSHALAAGEHSQPPAQRAAAAAAPPLANTSGASLQELQDRQRASSGSRSSSSKEGSEERPALHLSGVSSVRPSNGQEERLHSLVEAGDASTASADGDNTVEAFTARPEAVARLPRTSDGTNGSASVPLFATTRTETVEQLSAPAHDSTQASAVGNVSHCTAIREFTTITSSSSLSDSDSSEDDRRRVQEREAPTRRGAPSQERTDDVSSDLTTAIMLTSEASAKQSSQRGSRPPPSSGQQLAAKMSTAWRQCSSGSSEEGTPAARRAALGSAPPPQSQYPTGVSESESESVSQGAGALEDSDDRVQAMSRHDSDTEEVERAVTAEEAVAGVAHLQPTCASQTAATTYLARSPGNPNWNDWDEDGEEDDDAKKCRGNSAEDDEALEPPPARPHAGRHAASAASEDDTDDAVVRFQDAESSSDTPGPRETGVTTSAAGLAATVMHRRQDAADDLRATPRRMFVSTSDDGRGVGTQRQAAQLPDSVPRHGRGTTSSSSSSAERAEALGLRGARQSQPQRAATQMRQYTNFDDSTSSDDD